MIKRNAHIYIYVLYVIINYHYFILINFIIIIYYKFIITITEWISPPVGKNEFNKIIKSTARILSQSILQMANLCVISSVVSASLSNSPQLCSISSSISKED